MDIEYFLAHQAIIGPVLLLIIEEAGIPLPVPGDVIIAYTGFNVSRGLLPYWEAFIILNLSVLLGSSVLFWLSSKWGNYLIYKFGHLMHLHPERMKMVEKYFKKYGPLVIIFGRHIPGFRIPITVFAGISGVSYKTFITSTFLSIVFWIAIYLDIGIRLGPRVTEYLKASAAHFIYVVLFVILFIAALYIYKRILKK